MPVPDKMLVKSLDTDGINQCGRVRSSAGTRYSAGICWLEHTGTIEGLLLYLIPERNVTDRRSRAS